VRKERFLDGDNDHGWGKGNLEWKAERSQTGSRNGREAEGFFGRAIELDGVLRNFEDFR
jgi:hypothetical protein